MPHLKTKNVFTIRSGQPLTAEGADQLVIDHLSEKVLGARGAKVSFLSKAYADKVYTITVSYASSTTTWTTSTDIS